MLLGFAAIAILDRRQPAYHGSSLRCLLVVLIDIVQALLHYVCRRVERLLGFFASNDEQRGFVWRAHRHDRVRQFGGIVDQLPAGRLVHLETVDVVRVCVALHFFGNLWGLGFLRGSKRRGATCQSRGSRGRYDFIDGAMALVFGALAGIAGRTAAFDILGAGFSMTDLPQARR